MTSKRSAREVLEDHLALARTGDFETDVACNVAEDIVLLTSYGIFRGIDGVRDKVRLLNEQLPGGRWDYRTTMVDGEMGFLEWTAVGPTMAPAWRTVRIRTSSATGASTP